MLQNWLSRSARAPGPASRASGYGKFPMSIVQQSSAICSAERTRYLTHGGTHSSTLVSNPLGKLIFKLSSQLHLHMSISAFSHGNWIKNKYLCPSLLQMTSVMESSQFFVLCKGRLKPFVRSSGLLVSEARTVPIILLPLQRTDLLLGSVAKSSLTYLPCSSQPEPSSIWLSLIWRLLWHWSLPKGHFIILKNLEFHLFSCVPSWEMSKIFFKRHAYPTIKSVSNANLMDSSMKWIYLNI